MGIEVVDSSFSGFTGASATESVTVPAGAQAGDTLIAVISRRAALVEDMSAWTLQVSQQASDQNLPSIQQWVDIYTKPFNGDSTVSIEFTATNTRNSLSLIVARTSAGSIEVVWSDSFAEYSGSGGTIENNRHRFPYRADAASTEQLVVKASTCKYAQQSGNTEFNDNVGIPSDEWAEQHTPTSAENNSTFVATEIVSAGSGMLDGSGIGSSVGNNAHAKHTTAPHDGASITIVFSDPNDTPPTPEQQFNSSYADVSGRDPLPTALTQRTTAQQLVNYLVGLYAGTNPRIVEKPVQIEQGELGKTSPAPASGDLSRQIWIEDDRDPNFKGGRWATILGRSGGSEPGTVTLTLFIADNDESFVEPT